MYNIDTHRCCSGDVKETVMNLEKLGHEQYMKFCEERLRSNTVSIHEPLKKTRLPTFGFTPKEAQKSKTKNVVKSLKSDIWLFGRLYVAVSNNRPCDLDLFFSHESHEIPPAFVKADGKKADLVNFCLKPLQTTDPDVRPKVTFEVLDGGYLIHLLKPGQSCAVFSDFIQNVFHSFILRECKSSSRLDIIWDRLVKFKCM